MHSMCTHSIFPAIVALCLPLTASAGAPSLTAGSLLLVNDREIAAERTEVRFSCPPGSVLTGIGARAHADNITTMWFVHRELRPDGSLGEPVEVKRGSERMEIRITLGTRPEE